MKQWKESNNPESIIFVFHQTGLDARSKAWRPIKNYLESIIFAAASHQTELYTRLKGRLRTIQKVSEQVEKKKATNTG